LEGIDRAVELIEACGAGEGVEGHIDVYPNPAALPAARVSLEKINRVLGIEISRGEAAAIWQSLQIKVLREDEGSWLLEAPSWRKDLQIEEDYMEEAARLYGYDKLPATMPAGETTQGYRLPGHQLRRLLTRAMTGQGYREVVNYSFINPANLDKLGVPQGHPWRRAVMLMNPLSEEQKMMRTTVLPSMINRAVYNIRQQNRDLRLFEMGKTYRIREDDPHGQPEECWTLGLVCTGSAPKSWLSRETPLDFYEMKGAVDTVLDAAGIIGAEYAPPGDAGAIPGLHPGRSARILHGGRELGFIGEVDPRAAQAFEADQRLTAASLDILAIQDRSADKEYRPLGRYPELTRDLAVALLKDVPAAEVESKIRAGGGGLLREVRLFDEYEGEQVGADQKSLAFALTWRSDERTLNDEEIEALHQEIEKGLADTFGGTIRGR